MRIRLTGICLLSTLSLCAQEVAIEAAHANIAYDGIPNPMVITFPSVKCSALHVTTAHGRLRGSGCRYEYYAGALGMDTIRIMVNGRLATEKIIWVRRFTNPTIWIGDSNGGAISRSTLASASRPIIKGPDNYACFEYTLTKCTLVLKKGGNNTPIYQREIENATGVAFSAEDMTQLESLQRGDSVIIENQLTKCPDYSVRRGGANGRFFLK